MKLSRLVATFLATLLGTATLAGWAVAADNTGSSKPSGQPEMHLPPGWTPEDMQAYVQAGTPGEMHARMAKDAGTWQGKTIMWMGPESDSVTGQCTMKVSPMMDGRYCKCEMSGELPGMGSYSGFGLYGYDNVAKHFVSTWIDNQSTGIMYGTGQLSDDGRTLSWTYHFHCPITKKQTVMKEVETVTGPDSKTLEMFGADPKSGKEYKMMRLELTRQNGAQALAQ